MENPSQYLRKVIRTVHPVEKDVRKGALLSPKLFTACLEMVFGRLSWKGGISVNGEQFNH